jgi:hypothetical protein
MMMSMAAGSVVSVTVSMSWVTRGRGQSAGDSQTTDDRVAAKFDTGEAGGGADEPRDDPIGVAGDHQDRRATRHE